MLGLFTLVAQAEVIELYDPPGNMISEKPY